MKTSITSAQAMLHPTVVETFNALSELCRELREELETARANERDFIATKWENLYGYDKQGVAEFILTLKGNKMNKMTDWFPPHIKPVREGVYEIKYTSKSTNGDPRVYATWNGLRWSSGSYYYVWSDKYHKQFYGANQDKYWRGFTEKQT